MAVYNYTKSTVFIDTLTDEILDAGLDTYDYTHWTEPDSLSIYFTSTLSAGDETTLDNIVTNHTGEVVIHPEGEIAISDGEGNIIFVSHLHSLGELTDVPFPPSSGTYILEDNDGELSWVSPDSNYINYISFGESSDTVLSDGCLLKVTGGSTIGYLMPDSGSIKQLSVLTDVSNNNEYEVLKNDSIVETLTLSGTISGSINNLNISYSQNDILKARISTTGSDINSSYSPDSNTLFLAHFDSDNASSRHITNSSTIVKGMSGRVNGATLNITGKFNKCVDFDGSNDYIEFLHHDNYETQNCTVEFWFKPDDVSGTQHLFSKDSSGYDTGGHLTIGLVGDEVYFRQQSSSASKEYTSSGKNLVAGTWYHLALVMGTGGIKFFLDGTQVYSDGTWTNGFNGNREPFVIGAGIWGNTDSYVNTLSYYFHGKIDELRISDNRRYDNNFSVSTEAFTSDSNTVGLWHLDETSGSVVEDSSGTIHNTMIQASGSFPSIDASTVKIGTHSLKMNNSSNDWLRTIHTSDYEVTAFTVEGWIYQFTDCYDGIIFQKGDSNTEGGLQIKWIDLGDKLDVTYWGSSTSRIITPTDTFDSYEWNHFAVTIDDSNFKVYINGSLVDSESLTADFQNVWTNNTDDIYIASRNDRTLFMQAYYDEFRISDIVRTYGSSDVKKISMLIGV